MLLNGKEEVEFKDLYKKFKSLSPERKKEVIEDLNRMISASAGPLVKTNSN